MITQREPWRLFRCIGRVLFNEFAQFIALLCFGVWGQHDLHLFTFQFGHTFQGAHILQAVGKFQEGAQFTPFLNMIALPLN